ncbi:MAG: acyl carrier protein [Thermodesulfobacteriota bacterium]
MINDIRERVRRVLAEHIFKEINALEIGDDVPLIEYGVGIDSVARLEFLVALEEEFGVKLDESEITPDFFDTVGTISDYISRSVR